MKLAYLCGQYPAISHTFVLREVEALRRRGLTIDTFTIRRAGEEHLLTDNDRFAYATTFAILPPRLMRFVVAHLRLLVRFPLAYLRTLILALGMAPAGFRGHVWQVFYFAEAVTLYDECERRGIRHIHVHLANVAADVALLATELGSAGSEEWSWSFTMHGPTEFFDVRHFRLAAKVRHARFVVCISDFARSQLMSLCEPQLWHKLHVIHVGIPIAQFTRGEGDVRDPETRPTILFIGRQVPEKGQGVLLEAVKLLAERGCDVEAILAGDGSARADFERFAAQLGIAECVSFVGAVGQDDIHGLYARASIFALPSFAEGVPGVLMEAMAMEVPVVSTRIAGVPELVENGRNGLLVAPGRADLLADAFELLLNDPALCSELRSAARAKVVSQFEGERSAAQVHALFTQELMLPAAASPLAARGVA